MKIYCTRPRCGNPNNYFPDLDNPSQLDTVSQKYCTTCGMPLILAGRYLPEKLLGQGGFGAAFLARDRYTPTKRLCVVKQFQPPDSFGPQELAVARELFNREAEVLEKLGRKHPQIPDLYAFFPLVVGNEQFFYLVQEFVDGETLEQELATKGPFSEAEAIDFLKEMLPILQFIHEHDSIHRDIKPSNIMRSKEGKLYLLDFGAVKQVTRNPVNPQKKSSTGIYSQGFAPPEQMAGEIVYPCTDLYALAATCVNLLTGKDSKELYDFYDNRWQNWRQYTQIGDRFYNILEIMLRPRPQDRPQSAQEVLYLLNSNPQPAPSPPNSELTQPPQIQPQPSQPSQTTKPNKPNKPTKPTKPPISLVQLLSSAGFIGFESTLIGIIFTSIFQFPTSLIGLGISFIGLILLVCFRWIEKWDFLVIGLINLALVWFISPLHDILFPGEKILILILPVLVAAGVIAITALFGLIYHLLLKLF